MLTNIPGMNAKVTCPGTERTYLELPSVSQAQTGPQGLRSAVRSRNLEKGKVMARKLPSTEYGVSQSHHMLKKRMCYG